jgi:hypothetical protein
MLPSAKNKSTPDSPPVCLMVLPKSELLDKPLLVGHPLSLDTLLKDLESSVSMKSSRTSTKTLSDNKMLKSTKKSDGPLPQAPLK